MNLRNSAKSMFTVLVAAQMVIAVQTATAAQAKMLTTDSAIQRQAVQYDRAYLLSEIRKDEVRKQLVDMGVDPAEAEARLTALTDDEIARMSSQIDEQTAGSGIIGTLGTIFIILLFTDLMCWTHLFNFTRCIR